MTTSNKTQRFHGDPRPTPREAALEAIHHEYLGIEKGNRYGPWYPTRPRTLALSSLAHRHGVPYGAALKAAEIGGWKLELEAKLGVTWFRSNPDAARAKTAEEYGEMKVAERRALHGQDESTGGGMLWEGLEGSCRMSAQARWSSAREAIEAWAEFQRVGYHLFWSQRGGFLAMNQREFLRNPRARAASAVASGDRSTPALGEQLAPVIDLAAFRASRPENAS